jgi:hypothetical protein
MCSVVAKLEEEVVDYLRWVLGQRQFNAAPRQTHR